MKYISLCSGSKGNCSLILEQDTIVMIDCGANQKYIKEKLDEIGMTLDRIDAVFVTHDHQDHIRGLRLCKDIPWFGCADVPGIRTIEKLTEYPIKQLRIIAIPLSHDTENTVGYVVFSDKEKLVYITDTGYVPKRLSSLIQNAEYYFIESNHDVEMLMKTDRPQYIKARIYCDRGHLCNEDCANALAQLVGPSTREITLAHLSEQANDPKLAYQVVFDRLKDHPLCTDVIIQVAKQFEVCIGGNVDEKSLDSAADTDDLLECVLNV